jgi:hypothetical protein
MSCVTPCLVCHVRNEIFHILRMSCYILLGVSCEKRNNPHPDRVMCYALFGVSCEEIKNTHVAHVMCYGLLNVM